MDNISITPDVVFFIAGFIPVTSAHIALFIITMTLALLGVYFYRTASLVPTSLQVVFEGIYDWFLEKVESSFSDPKRVNRILPLVMTFFLVIIVANLFGLLPIINSLVLHLASGQDISLFHVPTSHLSMTLAFTIITLAIAHITALRMRPLKYIGKFFQFGGIFRARSVGAFAQAILDFLLGLLDIIGEIAKLISLSCRLFGNVLAGELMVIVVMSLAAATQFFVPLPFIILSLISGVIQAVVFSLLSLNYISLAIASVED